MQKLTLWTKSMLAAIAVGSTFGAVRTYGKGVIPPAPTHIAGTATVPSAARSMPPTIAPSNAHLQPLSRPGTRPLRVALSQWPGHMALLFGAGGLKTRPDSIAATEGLDLEIRFIEDAPTKNEALRTGEVDVVWQTVDELPISLGAYRSAGVDARAFMQIDWSRGGDACIATKDITTVEGAYGKKVGHDDVLARPHGIRVHDQQLAFDASASG